MTTFFSKENVLKALPDTVSQHICSSQVITNLKNCVKELLENAIDAKATAIEIRLVNNGMTLVEVRDNGHGIAREDFAIIAQRSSTSKISHFEDIEESLNTFGFRGEALNSLCAVCDLTLCTRTLNEIVATQLTFDHRGNIIRQESQAREVGTTVSCQALFRDFPVRLKEFSQTRRQQVATTLSMLQAYAILYGKVRFLLTNDLKSDGKRLTTLLSTTGAENTLEGSATRILGKKVVESMQRFYLKDPKGDKWSMEGLISYPQRGRKTKDIQLFYVNSRPIDISKRIERALNDTFKQFSSRLYPACIINIQMHTHTFDINITPDKRSIFLEHEIDIAENIKACLQDILAPTMASLHLESLSQWLTPASSSFLPVKEELVETPTNEEEVEKEKLKHLQSSPPRVSMPESIASTSSASPSWEAPLFHHEWKSLQTELLPSSSEPYSYFSHLNPLSAMEEEDMDFLSGKKRFGSASQVSEEETRESLLMHKKTRIQMWIPEEETTQSSTYETSLPAVPSASMAIAKERNQAKEFSEGNNIFLDTISPVTELTEDWAQSNVKTDLELTAMNAAENDCDIYSQKLLRRIDIGQETFITSAKENASEKAVNTSFLNQEDSESCEDYLPFDLLQKDYNGQFYFKQHLFRKMTICGQYNRGFVITCMRLGIKPSSEKHASADIMYEAQEGGEPISQSKFVLSLFIVDQHAADEKARFETLNQNSSLVLQPLLSPMKLHLMPSQESIVEAHIELFRKNGFIVRFNNSEVSGKRVHLMSLPATIQGITLDESDFLTLVHYLEENPFYFSSDAAVEIDASNIEQQEEGCCTQRWPKTEDLHSIKTLPCDFEAKNNTFVESNEHALSMSYNSIVTKVKDATSDLSSITSGNFFSEESSRYSSASKVTQNKLELSRDLKQSFFEDENMSSTDRQYSTSASNILHTLASPPSLSSACSIDSTVADHEQIRSFKQSILKDATFANFSDIVPKNSASSGSAIDVEKLGETECLWAHSGGIPRPPRIWNILASKACRSAVMIGDVLNHHQMTKIVHKLADLDQPWNCPHGRPTMRHLISLSHDDPLLCTDSTLPPPSDGPLQLDLSPEEFELITKL